MVHQHPLVVGALTVAENFSLGGLGDGSPASMLEAVADVVQTIPLEVDPRARIDSLPMSLRQRVEIVRCLAHGVRVLVLDEPTAGIDPETTIAVMEMLSRLHREQQLTLLMVNHDLPLARKHATDVLRVADGKVSFETVPNPGVP